MVQVQGQKHLDEILKARHHERHQRRETLQAQMAEKELELKFLKQQLAEVENDPNTQTLAARQAELVKDRTAWLSDIIASNDRLECCDGLWLSEQDKKLLVEMNKTLDRFGQLRGRSVALQAQYMALRDAQLKVGFCKLAIETLKHQLKGLTEDCGAFLG
ncbi:hypothetical protein KCU81_g4318, partial [Aureobasidium melanogenum]|uniref:Uncharacterized protein n=1 Tax=Aureobasidium melanogenum (strain CBS 110374) TaxID=1043003 RepID=A0A074WJV7_AURM1